VDAKTATDILTIVGLIVSLIGGALGAFSIIVTWKLYQAGNSVNLETLKLLHQVSASSHTTEVTSTHYTERLVTGLIDLTQKAMRDNLEWGRISATKRVEAALNENLGGLSPELAAQIKGRLLKDLSDTFRTLEYEAAAIGQIPEPELPQFGPTQKQSTMLAPGVPRLVQWIVKHQPRYEFLSVKFLREKLFASDPPLQEALQFCIDRGVLELYDRPNPRGRTTKACRLNLEHPLTQQLLKPPHRD
jgi:hypothetical protein